MEKSIFIARVFGLCYLIMGAGFLLNRKAFQQIMEDFCKNAALVFLPGCLRWLLERYMDDRLSKYGLQVYAGLPEKGF